MLGRGRADSSEDEGLGSQRADAAEAAAGGATPRASQRLPLAEAAAGGGCRWLLLAEAAAAAGGASAPGLSAACGDDELPAALSATAGLSAACDTVLISDDDHSSPAACDGDDHCSSEDYGSGEHGSTLAEISVAGLPASGAALRCERSRSRERPTHFAPAPCRSPGAPSRSPGGDQRADAEDATRAREHLDPHERPGPLVVAAARGGTPAAAAPRTPPAAVGGTSTSSRPAARSVALAAAGPGGSAAGGGASAPGSGRAGGNRRAAMAAPLAVDAGATRPRCTATAATAAA